MNPIVIAAFQDELLKISSEALEKDSLFGFGAKKALPQVAKTFVPSFKGHAQALKSVTGTRIDPRQVVQTKAWNPMAQTVSRQTHVTGVPGWTDVPQARVAA
jgi:hypothetical protein